MSLFAKLVVKAEERELSASADTVSALTASTESFERRFWSYLIRSLMVCIGSLTVVFFAYHNKPPILSGEIPELWLYLLIITCTVIMIVIEGKNLIKFAVWERISIRRQEVDAIAAAARKLAEAAEKERQRQSAVSREIARLETEAKIERQRKAVEISDLRLNLLGKMENGLKEVLVNYRRRGEWVPDRADEEKFYEMIRLRLKQAAPDVPEFGILRRSTDITVLLILGDRTCLPQDPPDVVIARRRIPSMVNLIG